MNDDVEKYKWNTKQIYTDEMIMNDCKKNIYIYRKIKNKTKMRRGKKAIYWMKNEGSDEEYKINSEWRRHRREMKNNAPRYYKNGKEGSKTT